MALLVVYAEAARAADGKPHFGVGDVVSVLPDDQHPGKKVAEGSRFGFVIVPGSVERWKYLEDEGWIWEVVSGEEIARRAELVHKRLWRTVLFDAPLVRDLHVDWETPLHVSEAIFAASIEKKPVKVR